MIKSSNFIFKPPKKTLFTSKTSNDLDSIITHKTNSNSLSKVQKLFNTKNPTRPLSRFFKTKVSGTGIDPSKIYLHFINKDNVKPYKNKISPIITEGMKYNKDQKMRWSLGTTYKCYNKDLLPKMEKYKEYYFKDKSKNEKNKFRINYLSTDHISIRYPDMSTINKLKKNNNNNYYFLKMKGEFNSNNESLSFWKPYNIKNDNNFNRSSVNYNIINNKDNSISGKKDISLTEKTINNKRKGLGEFYHLQRDYEPNYNPKYNNFFRENKSGFKKYKGIFTEMYDSYNRNGNIYKPFKLKNK